MLRVLDVLLFLLVQPLFAACNYLLILSVASRKKAPPALVARTLKFEIVVPAHNEEAGIASTVQSLAALEWPRDLFRVTVVADNCTDATADRARAAGARVIVRDEADKRGKGYALAKAFDTLLAEGFADAAVVVDADTVVSPNLLAAFAARLEAGSQVAQADYTVHNVDASWRTRLMAVAFGMFHTLRSLGRERLGMSCGLRGNGMCFTARVLREVPHEAVSLVEDVEHGLRLGEAGHRIAYVHEAHVFGEMVSSGEASRSQRLRWEEGRKALARTRGQSLLIKAALQKSPMLFDLALDLFVPPLSKLALATFVGLLLAAPLAYGLGGFSFALYALSASALCLVVYVFRGWMLSGTGVRGLLALACAPFFILWKLTVRRKRAQPADEWVRTARGG